MKNVIVTGLNLFAGKGQPGTPIERIQCITEELKGGIEGDCHYGEGEKQVSITSEEILKWMQEQETEGLCFAKYNANIVVKGSEGQLWSVGEKIVFGEAVLKITGRGKKCFNECRRHAAGMDCRLRDGCCYAKVVKAGEVRIGDMVNDAAQAEPYRWNRYARQMTAQMHGREGQQKLRQGSVLVVGAGGLGCPAITALAEAGVGRIGIVDGDVIEETNLNRQFFYTLCDIGKEKAGCAAKWVEKFRPDCRVDAFRMILNAENAGEIVKDYDIVVAAVDQISTRMMLNKVTRELHIPLIDGAIDGFYGTVTAVTDENAPCLSCMNPEGIEPAKTASSLGTTTMIIGALEAQYAISYLAGITMRAGYVLSYDGLSGTLEEVGVVRNPDCKVCGNLA